MTRIRALLVDDERPARDRLRGMLSGFDDLHIIDEAADGEEAIQKISRLRPDLVFLDIQMPGRTGMEVASSLEPPRPRIIFCTAYDRYAIDAFEHHAIDYLLKPLNRERLARAVERVRRSLGEPERLRREVVDASETQARLFPRVLPSTGTLDYSGACRAARGVGGDYYDFLPVGERGLGIALGDVSGKGLVAGLLMASLQARIQSIAPHHGAAVDKLAGEINALMHASTESNKYVTLFYGLYDDSSRSLTYVNAGHPPPMLLRPGGPAAGGGHDIQRLEVSGTVIGLLAEAEYRRRSLQLVPGDILLIFSDGLIEATNQDEEEFGEARLERTVRRQGRLSAALLRDRILGEVRRFQGGATQRDDITLVVIRVV